MLDSFRYKKIEFPRKVKISKGKSMQNTSFYAAIFDSYQIFLSDVFNEKINPLDLNEPTKIFLLLRNKFGADLSKQQEEVIFELLKEYEPRFFVMQLLNVMNRFSIEMMKRFIDFSIEEEDAQLSISLLKPLIRVYDYRVDLELQCKFVTANIDLKRRILRIFNSLNSSNLFTMSSNKSNNTSGKRYLWTGNKFIKTLAISDQVRKDYEVSADLIYKKKIALFLNTYHDCKDEDLKDMISKYVDSREKPFSR